MRAARGFTVVELLITMAVIAIIAGVAYPSYQAHLRKGHRAAAQSFMVEVANRQAQYLLDARNYAVGSTALTDLNVSAPADVTVFYDINVENSAAGTTPTTPPTYRVRATPKTGSAQVPDGELILVHDGTKSRAGVAGW